MLSCPPGQVFHGWSIANRVFLMRCQPADTVHGPLHTKSMNILFLLAVCFLTFCVLWGILGSIGVMYQAYQIYIENYKKTKRLGEVKRKMSIIQNI